MSEEKTPRLENLQEEAKADLAFEMENADVSAMKMSSLREKWCRYAVQVAFAQKRAEQKKKERYKNRHEFYMTQYSLKPDRRDIDIYIEADEEYQKFENAEEYWKQTSKYVAGILEALDRAGYNIASAVKFFIFKNGG